MFQPPPTKRRDVGGQVVDLETAVKDGIIGGGGGDGDGDGDGDAGGGGGGDKFLLPGSGEKPDLKAMVEELDSMEVPSVFICPISLEPMLDPVTLCTGQTYERANIVKWFALGRFTCPTTMQELWDHSLTPNKTLHHLTSAWFAQKYLAAKKRSEDVQGRASHLLHSLKTAKGQARVRALKDLRHLLVSSAPKTAAVDASGVALIASLLGPFTSYAVGSEAVAILVNLDLDAESRAALIQPAKLSLLVDMLNEGCVDTKINCTRLISLLIQKGDLGSEVVWGLGLLVGLLRLVKDKRHPNGVLAGLGLLHTVICSHDSVRNSAVSIRAVPQLVELLPGFNSECLALALSALQALSALPEAAAALKDCPNTIPNLVKVLMRVSVKCTDLATSILWAVFRLAPQECAPVAVEAGLAAKLLLVIQSGCDPVLKQRSAELLKLCSLNYSSTIFISKCKLTRTMQ